ncbi:MAG: signal peptidase I [Patescibacteria group bacterium]|jgi:signal peptidase I
MKNVFLTVLEVVKTFAIVLLVAFLLRKVIVQPFIVEGSSMEPNFHNNEYLLVDQVSYRLSEPKRGDVVIFKAPTNMEVNYIKRVIGLPGETVEIKDSKIYVNKQELGEPFLTRDEKTYINDSIDKTLNITLNANELFVLGDNRENSSDSREWGILPQENIIGRVFLIIYPFNDFHWQGRGDLKTSGSTTLKFLQDSISYSLK